MKLAVEIFTGPLFYVEVDDASTVGNLKKEIGTQENLPSHRLVLILNVDERSLLDNEDVSLKECGVEDGSHLYVLFEPLGNNVPSSPLTPQYAVANEPSTPSNVSYGHTDEPSASVDPSH
ncbi:hypothetical protein Salat_1216700 [Sesamum alatum]|uniref:Ubiquitin-like domain-containing protein n=1 Tax=Sesamum alatum TaxID=300844 RepID=A0AAE1YFE1_9LAMI|nr:hypothetical protein Salat_1216700 [Sesamum alatum]